MNPPGSLRDRVLAAAAREPAQTRAQGRVRAYVGYGLAGVVVAALFFGMGGVSHCSGRPWALTIGIATGALVLAAFTSFVTFSRARSMVGRTGKALASVALVVPLATAIWLTAWNGRYVEPYQRIGYRCLGLTIAGATAIAAVAFTRGARKAVRAPALHGAAIAAVAGAWGGVVVDLWCPLTEPRHVLVGHVLPIVVVVLAGALVGWRVLSLRARPRD
jgi:hypothetical protein